MLNQCWLVNYRSDNREGARLAEVIAGLVSVRELDFSRLDAQLSDAARFDRVMVVGGDGTFTTVLNQACDRTSPLRNTPIGLVPIGTANDLAREVGTFDLCRGRSYTELPHLFELLPTRDLSVWELEVDGLSYGFCNYASLGFEGAVVTDFHCWRTRSKLHNRLLNRVMYSAFGLRHLLSFLRGVLIMDENRAVEIASTRGLVISNVKSHMGIGLLSRESDAFDDVIECVRASSPFDYLRMIGAKIHVLPSLRSLYRGREFSVEGVPVNTPLQIDGEPVPSVQRGRVAVRLKGTARILVHL